jgi:N-acetylglutamate synthase
VLRATPGLARGRSNNALPPCRALTAREIAPAIARVCAFASAHGVRAGIQVTPLGVHRDLDRLLDDRGWTHQPPTLVLVGDAGRHAATLPGLAVDDHAGAAWRDAWARCEPGRDVEAHVATVLARLRGRALFARVDRHAVGLAVPDGDLVGLFCVAVDAGWRRSGLGTALVRALLDRSGAARAYLQVEEDNHAARRLYEGLGFAVSHRYEHRTAR